MNPLKAGNPVPGSGTFKALALALLSFAVADASAFAQDAAGARAKHVIFLIGDGMGVNQRDSAERYLAETSGEKLLMNSLPNSELTATNSLSGLTDSAAAGTALSCGVKTKNGALGIDGDGKRVESIAELVKRKGSGMKVGILTSVPINHATPAAFYAHVSSRGSYSDITKFIAGTKFELLGGEDFLLDKGIKEKPNQMLIDDGYRFVDSARDYASAKAGGKLILTKERPLGIDRKAGDFDSEKLLAKAMELLDGPEGFFIMLEGGKIDWCCHDNDFAAAVKETVDFDGSVKAALDFYKRNPADTLIVVTADHETGGLSFTGEKGKIAEAVDGQKNSKSKLQAYMEKSKKDKAPFEEVRAKMVEEFGFKELQAKDEAALKDAYAAFLEEKSSDARAEEIKKMYGGKNPVLLVCSRIVDAKAGVKWSTFGHSNAKVRTTAIGPGSELFKGEDDNTQIPLKIKKAMGLE